MTDPRRTPPSAGAETQWGPPDLFPESEIEPDHFGTCVDCDHLWSAHNDDGCQTGCPCTEPGRPAAAPDTERLDVERLGAAMHNVGVTLCDNGGPGSSLDDVATEYARLTAAPEDTE